MIYAVTEWCSSDHEFFFFDTDKVNISSPFEVAYAEMLEKASKTARKSARPKTEGTPLEERFGEYCDSVPQWESLKTFPPCHVDAAVTIWFG